MRRKPILALTLAALLAGGVTGIFTGQIPPAAASDASTLSLVTEMLNAERARNGLGQLQPDANLNTAAAKHARDMVQRGYYSHQSPDGKDFMDRVKAAGYCRASVAENIAEGWNSAAKVVKAWFASPSHRKNMMNRKYVRFGIGEYQGYWVMNLAGPCV